MQLQHRSTISRARLLEQLTVEPVPNSPVGVSPFLFRPPDGPAAVEYLNTPPAIAQPFLIRSEIAAGILHRELTPLAHSRHPLARRKQHLHCGLCVCACVCLCVTYNQYKYFFLCPLPVSKFLFLLFLNPPNPKSPHENYTPCFQFSNMFFFQCPYICLYQFYLSTIAKAPVVPSVLHTTAQSDD